MERVDDKESRADFPSRRGTTSIIIDSVRRAAPVVSDWHARASPEVQTPPSRSERIEAEARRTSSAKARP